VFSLMHLMPVLPCRRWRSGTDFRFMASEILGRKIMKLYPLVDDLLRPVLWVAMARAPCLTVPGGSVHVVGRCTVES